MKSLDGSVGGRDAQTYAIIGAAMEVHRTLGSEFLEPAYQAALEVEFGLKGIPCAREVTMPIQYKGVSLGVKYRADFVCFDSILVELKSLERLTKRETAQVVHYLAASRIPVGLLLNFGSARLQYRRFVGPSNHVTSNRDHLVGPYCPQMPRMEQHDGLGVESGPSAVDR
jgi:GxxExxY protein